VKNEMPKDEPQVRDGHVGAEHGEQVVDGVDREVEVLEERKNAQIVDDRHEEQRLARVRARYAREGATDEVVERAAHEDDAEAERAPADRPQRDGLLPRRIPGAVEVEAIAGEDQEQRARQAPRTERPEDDERREQERAVEAAVEQHWRGLRCVERRARRAQKSARVLGGCACGGLKWSRDRRGQ
jgi:hypothetical protein